jgi:uncharacterized protein (DUF1501 family)
MKRRQILQSAAALGLGSFTSWQALAQSTSAGASDYKALVCLFMYGGNDANNMLLPSDSARYATYTRARTNLSINPAQQLALNVQNATGGDRYGFHPAMTGLAQLFNAPQSKLAAVANVGPILVPTTKAQWEARSVPLPDNLFSHSDQQNQWQAAQYERPANGWGGRLLERLVADGAPNRGYSVMSVTGGNLWQTGERSLAAYKVSASGKFGFDFYEPTGNDPLSLAITQTLAERSDHLLEQGFVDVMGRSIEVQRVLTRALEGTAVQTAFPNTSLGQQMGMIARLIAARDKLGLKRQCFFCGIGGFDTHGDDQITRHAELLGNVSDAMSAFYAATAELGVANNVTTFTASDFNRTFASNGQGSDHAWGTHQLVMGGAVQGGRIHGTYPNLALRGPDDSGNQGNWIPTTSTETFSATLGRWFGASEAQLREAFPRLQYFNPSAGFMAV